MKIDAIKAFVMVADSGSFSAAANELFVSQPTVTRLVRELEEELQCQLIVRNKKSCQLTQNGRNIYPHCAKILSEADNVLKITCKAKEKDQPSIRVSYTYGEMLPFLARSIASDSFQVKNLNFSMHYTEAEYTIQQLQDEKIDCALMHLPSLTNAKNLDIQLVCHCELEYVMAKSHPMAKQKTVGIDQLLHETDVRYTKDRQFYKFADNVLHQMNKPEMKHFYVDSIEEIMPNVLYNRYICLTPGIYPEWPETTKVRVSDLVMDYPLVLVSKTGAMNPLVHSLYQSLCACVSEHGNG